MDGMEEWKHVSKYAINADCSTKGIIISFAVKSRNSLILSYIIIISKSNNPMRSVSNRVYHHRRLRLGRCSLCVSEDDVAYWSVHWKLFHKLDTGKVSNLYEYSYGYQAHSVSQTVSHTHPKYKRTFWHLLCSFGRGDVSGRRHSDDIHMNYGTLPCLRTTLGAKHSTLQMQTLNPCEMYEIHTALPMNIVIREREAQVDRPRQCVKGGVEHHQMEYFVTSLTTKNNNGGEKTTLIGKGEEKLWRFSVSGWGVVGVSVTG